MIKLRRINKNDIEQYKYWQQDFHAYHSFNGPYYPKKSEKDIEEQMINLAKKLANNAIDLNRKKLIVDEENNIVGEVSWYWKSEETFWMEIGIVIFNEKFWNKGIGYIALKLWIDEIFEEHKELVRIGLSTWSGNHGMVKLSKKLGMLKEATYRKARIVNEKYYDSISFGVLREDWEVHS